MSGNMRRIGRITQCVILVQREVHFQLTLKNEYGFIRLDVVLNSGVSLACGAVINFSIPRALYPLVITPSSLWINFY